MSGLENLVGLTLQAMTATLSSATPSAQRREAQAYLQNLSDSVECSTVLQTILSQDSSDSYGYKMLALSMLHDWMKRWWGKITPTEHMQIRGFVCHILSQPVLRSQPSNFRSKFAAILSEIAERQFPQHWPGMMEDFLQIVNSDIEVFETIVRVIIFVYTDCTDQDFQNQLPTIRRQEIMAGLKMYEDKLIYLVFNHLASNIPHIQQQSISDPAQIAVITRTINLALELLETIIPVVSVDKIVSSAQNCLAYVCLCLSLSGVQMQASSCLSTLLSKKISLHILANNSLIVALYMRTLAGCRVTTLPSDAGDRYIFIKQYVLALSTFTEHHLENILSDDSSKPLLDDVVMQVVQAMQAPGIRATCSVVVQWTKIIRDEHILKYANAKQLAAIVIEAFYARAVKPQFILNSALDAPEFFEAEFDDEEDYKDFYLAYTSQLINLIAALATHFLDVLVEVMCVKLQQIVAMANALQQEAELGAFVRLLGGMVEYIKEKPDSATSVDPSTGARIIGLLDIVLTHSMFRSFLDEQIKLLSLYATIPLDVSYVTKIMSHLFTLLSAPIDQVKSAVKEEAGRAFAKCMSRYVGMLAKFPDVLSSILTQMNNILLNCPLSNDLQSSLRQSLLALLPSMTSPGDQEYVLNLCIQSYLLSLQQELAFFGQRFIGTLADQEHTESNLQHFDAVKTSLRHLISMLGKVDIPDDLHKAVTLEDLYMVSPLYKYWTEVVQLVLNIMMQLFHANLDLSHPSAYTHLVYAPSSLDVNRYLPGAKVPFTATPYVIYSSCLKDVSGFCYHHLGLATKHRLLYLYQPARQYVEEVFLKNLNNYDHGHFLWAAKFFIDKYLMYSYDFKHTLHHHVLTFTKYFLQHVVYRTQRIFSSDNATLSSGDKYIFSMQAIDQLYGQVLASDQIELLKEQISIDVVRQSLEVLKSLLALSGMLVTGLPKEEGNKETKDSSVLVPPNLARLESIRLYVFNDILLNPQIIPVFLQTLRLLLLIGDSAVATSVLQVCSLLVNVEVLKEHTALVDFVGKEMFSVLLFAMLRQEKWLVGGLEWNYTDLLLNIYAGLVMHLNTDMLPIQGAADTRSPAPSPLKNNAHQKKKVDLIHSNFPKQVLLETKLVTLEELNQFEAAVTANKTKKKARSLMKDLLGKMITSTLSVDYLQQVGSTFIKTSKIQDLANTLPLDKKERERAVKKTDYGQQGLGLSSIFDEDDPDL